MKLLSPKPNTRFYKFNGQLSLFHATSDHKEYWNKYWTDQYFTQLVNDSKMGKLQEFEHYAFKYIKPEHRILEAGCGPAHMVQGLVQNGFLNVVGIDYEKNVVAEVNRRLPHLQVKEGNVFDLQMAAGSLDAYLSFGVVEHFTEGPDAILQEACRVLAPNGIAMISVPYLNPLRKSQLAYVSESKERVTHDQLHFHQYYFEINSFQQILNRNGFELLEVYPYAIQGFLIREHTWFSRFWNSALCPTRVRKYIRNVLYNAGKPLRFRYAHMAMFICKKK